MGMTPGDAEALADELRKHLSANGIHDGGRIPSERDLATATGWSRPLVRRALHHLDHAGVFKRVGRKLRFLTGPGDPPVAAQTIAVVNGVSDLVRQWQHPHEGELMAVVDEIQRRGREARILSPDLLRTLPAARWPAQLIIMENATIKPGVLARLAQRPTGSHVVICADALPMSTDLATLADVAVCGDHRHGARSLVEGLHARGRRNLLSLMRPLPEPALRWCIERMAGYADGCAACGLALPTQLELRWPDASLDDPTRVQLLAGLLARTWADGTRHDAIITITDSDAALAAAAARSLGRRPGEDLDIVGYDGYLDSVPAIAAIDPYRPPVSVHKRPFDLANALVQACEQGCGLTLLRHAVVHRPPV